MACLALFVKAMFCKQVFELRRGFWKKMLARPALLLLVVCVGVLLVLCVFARMPLLRREAMLLQNLFFRDEFSDM